MPDTSMVYKTLQQSAYYHDYNTTHITLDTTIYSPKKFLKMRGEQSETVPVLSARKKLDWQTEIGTENHEVYRLDEKVRCTPGIGQCGGTSEQRVDHHNTQDRNRVNQTSIKSMQIGIPGFLGWLWLSRE